MSDYLDNNYLPDDHEEAEQQQNCFYYNNHLSVKAFKDNQFDRSIVYHENAARSLKALAELKDKHDKAWFRLKQIESDRTMKELVQNQLVKGL